MTRYFLVNNASPAATYGIGTHLRHLVECLTTIGDIEIVYIDLQCDTSSCQTQKDEKGYWHLQIPTVSMGMEDGVYNRNVYAEVVRWNESQKETARIIFHFHYEQHFLLASLLKAHYPSSQILYTIHYQTWAFQLLGDCKQLQKSLMMLPSEEVSDKEYERCQQIQTLVTIEKRMLSIADEVIVLSRFTQDILIKYYKISPSKLHFIPNAIADTHDAIDFSLDPTKQYILYVGRLDKGKGLDLLIAAFRQIHTSFPNTRLIVVGNGDYDAFFSEAKELWPHISWTGRLEATELQQLYQSVQVGVQPSFNEQCSYTIIEMLMNGLPVVGTDCSGVKEMIIHAPQLQVAFDAHRNDREQMIKLLAAVIKDLLSDPRRLKEESVKARKAYEERYTTEHATLRWHELLALTPRSITENTDLLLLIDQRCIDIINQRPDYMDLEFFGLTGISHYIWWRMQQLDVQEYESRKQRALLGEHLIYAIDWMFELALEECTFTEDCGNPALCTLCSSLLQASFYPTKIEQLQQMLVSEPSAIVTAKDVIINVLKICNYK
jgi:putative glycosyltransferase